MSNGHPMIIRLRALQYAATLCRFNIFILIAGFVLLFVAQGQDLLIDLAEDNAYPTLISGGLLWAWSIWYWARVLMDIKFPNPPVSPEEFSWWRAHLPRLLGAAAFVALGWNMYRATGWTWEVTVVALIGIGFYVLVLKRRRIGEWAAAGPLKGKKVANEGSWLNPGEMSTEARYEDWRGAWDRPPVKVMVGLGIIMFLWGMIHPLSMGETFNTLVLLFVWGATFLPGGSTITYVANRTGTPWFTILIVAALIFSHFNDNHRIRELAGESAKARPTLQQGLDAWTEKHGCVRGSDCPPFVVMATAGGGIRAAYWTGTVLGRLDDSLTEDKHHPLNQHLFAISGVSGGSVGATVYRAALAANVPHGEREAAVQKMLATDYLGPLAAGMLYPDLLQRFLPVAMLEDRATVFEEGLEAGFADTIREGVFDGSFTALTADDKAPWPALFLNSTWSDNGRRIVAAGYRMEGENVLYADLIERLGYDLRLSTAAHNSARFPFASPPGSWELTLGSHAAKVFDQKTMLQRLQDGGLFENYGAETAIEVLKAARRYFHTNGMKFDPLVILVSSDPSLPADIATPDINRPISFGYEVLSTFRTYAATRVGRGAEAASRLKDWATEFHTVANKGKPQEQQTTPESRFAYFRMCDDEAQETPPLGWALSHEAQRSIENYLYDSAKNDEEQRKAVPSCREGNDKALTKLLTALAR